MRSDLASFITPTALLAHWQAHRRLTRRVIAAFPEEELFKFSVGAMRPFGRLAMEIIKMSAAVSHGLATGRWVQSNRQTPATQGELLGVWDEVTAELDSWWPQIPAHRFLETVSAFGQYTGAAHDLVLYAIDNEVHHRGQGYVYLRALGVSPPEFQDRS
ncbi:MAG TPA: DinB family protein [Blastocatellia bacterium]|jgi:uncharacterized damage-inducible protein DinB